jgi:hypothetical protein
MVAKMHGAGNRSVVTSSCWRWQTDCLHSPPPSVMYRHKKQSLPILFCISSAIVSSRHWLNNAAYCCCCRHSGRETSIYITLEQSLDDHLRTLFPLSLSLSLSLSFVLIKQKLQAGLKHWNVKRGRRGRLQVNKTPWQVERCMYELYNTRPKSLTSRSSG